MWQRQSILSVHESSNPRKHLHTRPKRQVRGWILQHCMRKDLETPEITFHRDVSTMQHDAPLKRMRNVLAQRALLDTQENASCSTTCMARYYVIRVSRQVDTKTGL